MLSNILSICSNEASNSFRNAQHCFEAELPEVSLIKIYSLFLKNDRFPLLKKLGIPKNKKLLYNTPQ